LILIYEIDQSAFFFFFFFQIKSFQINVDDNSDLNYRCLSFLKCQESKVCSGMET